MDLKKSNAKKSDVKQVIIITGLILLIMIMSFMFRYMVNRSVNERLGEDYLDPETGVPYLTEMDSYYHLRMTRDIELYGHAGDTVKDGEDWDSLSYAPYGRSAEDYRPLMAYIAIGAHKLLSGFGVTLEQVAYWQGAVISAFVIIPVFLMVLRLKGMLAAVISAILSAINYGYFAHTVPGFYDTDTVISWTSCLLFYTGCLFAASLTNSVNREKASPGRILRDRIIYGLMFAASLLLLIGSWYIFYMFAAMIAGAVLVFLLIGHLYSPKEERGGYLVRSVPLLLFSGVLIIAVFVAKPDLISSVAGVFRDVFSKGGELFPNALVSVSEMRKPALIAGGFSGLFQMRVLTGAQIGVINAVGGLIPVLGAVTMCILLIRKIIKRDIRFEYVLLIIWFMITAVLAVRSWRFIMLFAVPVAVLAGMFTGTMYELMRDKKMMDYKIFAGMIAVLMLFPAIYGAYRSSSDSSPSVNRGMHDTLAYIKDNTGPDTIVTGWWDYGYFFEEKAVRRTLFDGGSQNGSRIYWVARAFATGNEELSSNIFRMLSGSGNDATERMLEVFGEDKSTLKLMDELLSSGRDEARAVLEGRGTDSAVTDELMSLLYPDIEEDVVCIITPGMSGITGWFSRFGYPDGEDGYADGAYSVILEGAELSGGPEGTVWRMAGNGDPFDIKVVSSDGQYRVSTSFEAKGDSLRPYHIDRVLVNEGGVVSEHINGDEGITDGFGCTVFIDADRPVPSATIVTSLLAQSVFGQLYYTGGSGLERFSLIEAPGSSMLYSIQ
ncbi:MAG: hypothetical protein K6F34_06980 [Lachnospiraceae bacterium]|nr:hypothetical protein [Lachnospiraceae bacterium]